MRAFAVLFSGFLSAPGPENLLFLKACCCGDGAGCSKGAGRFLLGVRGGRREHKSACQALELMEHTLGGDRELRWSQLGEEEIPGNVGGSRGLAVWST